MVWTQVYMGKKIEETVQDFYMYNFDTSELILVETGHLGFACHGLNDRELVYQRATITDQRFYKYTYATGEIAPLKTDLYAFDPGFVNYVDGDYLVFRNMSDNKIIKCNLVTDDFSEIEKLRIGTPTDFYYGIVANMGTDSVERYTVATDQKEAVGKIGWNPQLCTPNIMMWVKPLDGGQYMEIYDVETKVNRYVTSDPNIKYGAWCRGKYAVITPDASGSGAMRNFKIDLEKSGFIKDGHVVPESDGGL
jgi:hypothetical protein